MFAQVIVADYKYVQIVIVSKVVHKCSTYNVVKLVAVYTLDTIWKCLFFLMQSQCVDFIYSIYSDQYNSTTIYVLHLEQLDTFCNVFNCYNLLIIRNNHLCQIFEFIYFNDFLTLAFLRKGSLKKMEIHRNTQKCFTKQTLLLMYCAFIGLNNKLCTMQGTYIKREFAFIQNCTLHRGLVKRVLF